MATRLHQWILAVVALFIAATPCAAAQLTARLIYGTNVPVSGAAKDLAASEPRLAKAFGWREYQLLTETSTSLREGEVRQLDLGRKLLLRVKLLKDTKPTYLTRCQLLRGDTEILQTSVSMTSGSAYFITGPEYDNGQLLISVAIR
jgi:hypothetical protein